MKPDSEKLLIVEDEQLVALDLQALLEEMGYTVVGHAATAEEAVHLAGTMHPDLVLMDINLNGQREGIDAAAEIRKKYDLPIVFVSAYDDETTLTRAQITEPYGYLLKPYQPRELRVTIRMALFHHLMQKERQRLQRELEAALRENRTLQGLLPVCGHCKKIRETDSSWVTMEDYLQKHSAAKVSHGLCPDCTNNYLADLAKVTCGNTNG
jgi:DNA-binding NarL/FixJ family response regulator